MLLNVSVKNTTKYIYSSLILSQLPAIIQQPKSTRVCKYRSFDLLKTLRSEKATYIYNLIPEMFFFIKESKC